MIGCQADAEYEIFDENERRPDCGYTDACAKHVGELLGSVPPTQPVGPWRVFCIETAKAALAEAEEQP